MRVLSHSNSRPAGLPRPLFYFIGLWILVNGVQAYFTGLDGDEAYYWIFSHRLDWGYFDHPPMVALSVKFGEWIHHGPLFTRLGTILFSTGTVYFAYKALPSGLRDIKLYLVSFSSVVLFHVYGFIVTPDSSLLFFTALFFYAYRLYLKHDSFTRALFLSFSILGLLYSKYHGILPVFFTFLSNPKIFFRKSVWLTALIVVSGFLPHLLWQYHRDWPTVRYHLSERIGSPYRLGKTTMYLVGQLLVWGPFTTLPALYRFVRLRRKEVYVRAHLFSFFGILSFFFFNSFRSTIEPHWTLSAGVSFIVLLQLVMSSLSAKAKKYFYALMIANICLLLILRTVFILGDGVLKNVQAFRTQMLGESLTDSIYRYTAGTPVIFPDSYTYPSLYQYYHPHEETSGFHTVYSRRTQFTISADEKELNNKPVFVAAKDRLSDNDRVIAHPLTTIYLHRLDSFRAVNYLKIFWEDKAVRRHKAGQSFTVSIVIKNISDIEIAGRRLAITYAVIRSKKEKWISDEKTFFENGTMPRGYQKELNVQVKMPREKGKYRLVFSIVQPPFEGTIASPYYNVEAE